MTFLSEVKKNNQYPIIFIGSGITKRYFKDAPSWTELLKQLWDKIEDPDQFYNRLNAINTEINEEGANFRVLVNMAQELEKKYQKQYSQGTVPIDGLTQQDVFNKNISPMKKEIANILGTLKVNTDMSSELKQFKNMIVKARMIITTNYDDLIENQLKNNIKVNIGNRGLFQKSESYGELYKIHGSISEPSSIIITKDDYADEDTKLKLVNAKILSNLTESPIIFLGYSLTDPSVQTLLADLASNMNLSIEECSHRVGVVNWSSSHIDSYIEKIASMQVDNQQINLTEITAHDFTDIYKIISAINQGLTPHEILQYKKAVRKIIVSEGQKGELQPVLTSLVDLEHIDQELINRRIILAIGDERYMWKMPDYVDYVKSYFELNNNSENNLDTRVAIDFICSKNASQWMPVNKYIKKANKLTRNEKSSLPLKKCIEIVEKRKSICPDLKTVISSCQNQSRQATKKYDIYLKKHPVDAFAVVDLSKIASVSSCVRYIISTIKKYTDDQLIQLLKYIFDVFDKKTLNQTDFRKLYVAISLKMDPNLESLTA